jgi:hypothetical protein
MLVKCVYLNREMDTVKVRFRWIGIEYSESLVPQEKGKAKTYEVKDIVTHHIKLGIMHTSLFLTS